MTFLYEPILFLSLPFILTMDKVYVSWMVLVVLVLMCISDIGNGGDDEEQRNKPSLWEWLRLRRAYSIYSALFPSNISHFWYLLKTLLNHAYARVFPPNIDIYSRGNHAHKPKEKAKRMRTLTESSEKERQNEL
ncbi:hypothetical protein RJT34_16865 [Clitoria ternatea]|uniref:Uncharacterized protein n=1 Tax=Clitoria ternatea TaxID=43366 RepID=A0AAN9J7W4_CLITE